jgi:transposase
MVQMERPLADGRVRRRRTLAEKRRIVELTFEPGVSVSQVAQAHGVNANQVFKWRRSFERGELAEANSACLLPVVAQVSDETADDEHVPGRSPATGAIHIEFPGRAMISVESGADPMLLRSILESLRK